MPAAPQDVIRAQWERLSGLPLGKRLFALLLGRLVPYTGTLGARVEELGPGRAVVTMRERRALRNHLRSIHAAALLNLGELATGLALNYALPADARAILVSLCMDYHKKARGTITATCHAPVPESAEEREYAVEAALRDASGEVVATARARWRVGPRA